MSNFKNSPRYNVVSMRVSDDERKELQHIASQHSISISKMMRQAMDVYARCQNPGSSVHRVAC